MGPNGLHSSVLREQVDVLIRCAFYLHSKVMEIRTMSAMFGKHKCCNVKKPEYYMQFGLPLDPEKIIEQILWQHVSEHKEDNKVSGNSQHGFTKGK